MVANSRRPASNWLIGREVLGAFLIVVGLVAISTLIQVQLVQIPGYLLIRGSDLIQNPLLPALLDGHTLPSSRYIYTLWPS